MYVLTATPGNQVGKFVANPLPVRPNQPRQTKTAQLSNIDNAKRTQMSFDHKFSFWSDIAAVVGGGPLFVTGKLQTSDGS